MKTVDPKNSIQRTSPADVLRAIFVERKSKNASYSLNAFARDLDLSRLELGKNSGAHRNLMQSYSYECMHDDSDLFDLRVFWRSVFSLVDCDLRCRVFART